MKHLLAVYGTLKQGFGNNRLLQTSKLLGEQNISGFKMYSLGGYPAINIAEDSDIKIEVYEINDPTVLNRVYSLEGYTGKRNDPSNWYDTTEVKTKWGAAEIFYFKDKLENRPLVESGVWEKPVPQYGPRY